MQTQKINNQHYAINPFQNGNVKKKRKSITFIEYVHFYAAISECVFEGNNSHFQIIQF